MYTHTVTSETQPRAHTLPPSLAVSSLTYTDTHICTHTHQGHRSSQHQTTELELWTGREGFVHDMNKISGPKKAQSPQLFDAIGDPSVFAPMSIFPCIWNATQ